MKKIIVTALIGGLFFSPALVVRAQWVDISTAAKDYGLDALAWTLANRTIERMSASTVNWINSGFKGKPAYVTDPAAFYKDTADKVVGQFIYNSPNWQFLCGPISAKVRLALNQTYTQERSYQCTLTQIGKNFDDFMGNFENGGWDNFFELTQRQQNNPIGAYLQAEADLNEKLAEKLSLKQDELSWGQGMMSFKKCKPGTERTASQTTQSCDAAYNSCLQEWAGNEIGKEQCADKLRQCDATTRIDVGDCSDDNKETVTPGSVIQSQLNKQLGLGSDKLAVADEINEIVASLLNQVVSQVVGGIGSGLRGLSGSGSGGSGSPSVSSQLSNDTSTKGYFPETDQDTSILDRPLPTQTPGIDTPVKIDIVNNGRPVCDPSSDPNCQQ